jgi:hypothetical protein
VKKLAKVTTAELLTVGAATLVAVMVTDWGEVTEAGAVKSPVDESVPTAGVRAQVTDVSALPETVAVNCRDWP